MPIHYGKWGKLAVRSPLVYLECITDSSSIRPTWRANTSVVPSSPVSASQTPSSYAIRSVRDNRRLPVLRVAIQTDGRFEGYGSSIAGQDLGHQLIARWVICRILIGRALDCYLEVGIPWTNRDRTTAGTLWAPHEHNPVTKAELVSLTSIGTTQWYCELRPRATRTKLCYRACSSRVIPFSDPTAAVEAQAPHDRDRRVVREVAKNSIIFGARDNSALAWNGDGIY